jgi:iron complex outermembrane receptor protein
MNRSRAHSSARFQRKPVALALSLAISSTAALAQGAGGATQLSAPAPFSITAKPLAQALSDWAVQSGMQLIVQPSLVEGKTAPAVSGQFSARQALDRLLAGSGLSASVQGNAVVIQQAAPAIATSAAPETVLPTVTVTGYRADRVVGASKSEETLLDTPQNIQVVTRQRIEDQGASDVADVANMSASVNYADNGILVIRGFDQRADHNDFLRVDGLKGRTSSYTQPVTLANVERVETLKGANGVLYGAGIEGGVINLITKKPSSTVQRSIATEVGSYGMARVSSDFTGPLNEDKSLRYRFVAEGVKDGLQFDSSSRKDLFLAPSIEWVSGSTSALFQVEHRDSEQTPSYWGASSVMPAGKPERMFAERAFHSNVDFDKNKGSAVSARIGHFFESGQEVVGAVRYSSFNEQYRGHFGTSLSGDGRTLNREIYDTDNHIDGLSTSLYTVVPLSAGQWGEHKVLAGIDYEAYEGKQSSFWGWYDGTTPGMDIFNPDYSAAAPLPPVADRLAFDYSYKTQRAYIQDTIQLGDKWSAVLGLTYERSDHRETDGQTYTGDYDYNQLTKRAGVVYKPRPGHAVFASYTEGFKPADIWRNQPANGGPFEPQELVQYETGYQLESADKRFGLIGSIYSIEKTNIPYRLPGAGRNDPFFANTVKSQGFELDVTGQLTSQWFMQASYAYHDGKITDSVNPILVGQRQFNSNRHKVALWTRYNLQSMPGLGFGAGLTHIAGRAPSAASVDAPDYTVVELAAFYKVGKQWDLAFNVKNATDEVYVPLTGNREVISRGYGQPRSYYLTARYSF